MDSKTQAPCQPRIELTDHILRNFFSQISDGNVAGSATDWGLSYTLIYNLAHGRIRSLSEQDYRMIFGEEPPCQEPKRVDGYSFREMVRLWLFLNDDVTEKDLYTEFYQGKIFAKTDYRIFTGGTKSIEFRLEKIMEKKFLNQGLNKSEIEEWIEELDLISDKQRVSYKDIKPVLDYLQRSLEVNPTRILNQRVDRYESGEL